MMFSIPFVQYLLFILVASCCGSSLMPFGDELGTRSTSDQSIVSLDDGHVRIDLKTPFVINSEKFSEVFINVNGIITFEEPAYSFDKDELTGPFIAPFWGDVDLSGLLNSGNTIYYRVSESPQDLEWVREAIDKEVGRSVNWTPTTVVVATWDRVGHFMSQTSLLNTFQVVLATDGEESYTLFNYPPDGLKWWISEQGQASLVGFRTRSEEFLIEKPDLEVLEILVNATFGVLASQIFKLGGRPLIGLIEYMEHNCFFSGGSVTISGYGFIKSGDLSCQFRSGTRFFKSPASYVSFSQVICVMPPWDGNQIVELSVTNEGKLFSDAVQILMNDCILSFFPVRTCLGGGLYSVESFPVPWNSRNAYSCHFGNYSTPATVQNELLTCPFPEFAQPEMMSMRISTHDGKHRAVSSEFGSLTVHECGIEVKKEHSCSKREVEILWDSGRTSSKRNGFQGVLKYPSGVQKLIKSEGKSVRVDVIEDGLYTLSVSDFGTSFEVSC